MESRHVPVIVPAALGDLTPTAAGRLDRVTRRVIALVNRGGGRGSLLAA